MPLLLLIGAGGIAGAYSLWKINRSVDKVLNDPALLILLAGLTFFIVANRKQLGLK